MRLDDVTISRVITGSFMKDFQRAMDVEMAEKKIMENTREVYPGLIVTGMAADAVCGTLRMGPIFGRMLLLGRRAAEVAIGNLQQLAIS